LSKSVPIFIFINSRSSTFYLAEAVLFISCPGFGLAARSQEIKKKIVGSEQPIQSTGQEIKSTASAK
jgi:hypothetical protein